jgi:hypothetical protein
MSVDAGDDVHEGVGDWIDLCDRLRVIAENEESAFTVHGCPDHAAKSGRHDFTLATYGVDSVHIPIVLLGDKKAASMGSRRQAH